MLIDKRKIQEMFRSSEVFTTSGEAITPFYKVRENVEQFQIKEDELQEYLLRYTPKEYHEYVGQIIQKIYHPTEEDLQKGERLRLSSLR